MSLPIPPITTPDGRLDPTAVQYVLERIGTNWPSQYQSLGKAVGAFSVYRATTQAITTANTTRVQFASEQYDYSGWFDATTNFTYTPTIPGIYRLSSAVHLIGLGDGKNVDLNLYKDGAAYSLLDKDTVGAAGDITVAGTTLVEADGNDAWDIRVTHNHGSDRNVYGQALPGLYSYFQGHYVGGKP